MINELPGGGLTYLGVFILGLGLNLTPCVYPMLSVTLSLFKDKKHPGHWHAFAHALVYVIGMSVMYSALGVTSALGGTLVGEFLQNPWVLTMIGVLMVWLALSLFGVYAFQLPSKLLERLTLKKHADFVSLFFTGMFVGLFAAPCIGPPVIALMTYVGTKGDPGTGFLVFFVMSLGLGAPYLVLGTFTRLLRRMPKAGVWLVWFEKLFGVILLGLAVFYFIVAWKAAWLHTLWPVFLVGAGLYLGFIDNAKHYSRMFNGLRKAAGTLAVAGGLILLTFGASERVSWEPYSPESLAAAGKAGRSAVLDFYADWCIACHEMEQLTYTDPRVIEAASSFDRFKVDLTRPDNEEVREIISRYGIYGVPTVLFIDAAGQEVEGTRIEGFADADRFLTALKITEARCGTESCAAS